MTRRGLPLSLAVCSIPLLLTAWGYRKSSNSVENARRERFDRRVDEVAESIRERLAAYGGILKACEAFFAGSTAVDRAGFRAFVAALALDVHDHAIKGLGYAPLVSSSELAAFERAARLGGAPGFTVHPRGERADYFPILYVEGLDDNGAALGFDLGSEPNRRAAAERSRDTGLVSMTGRIALLQDREGKPGFLLVHAVYRHGARPTTRSERRAALRGWVYAAARVADVMRGLPTGEIDLEVYDGDTVAPRALLYESRPHPTPNTAGGATSRLDVGGHVWSLRLFPRQDPSEAAGDREPFFVLLGGLLASTLTAAIAFSLSTTRARAIALAHTMTESLRQSEERFRASFEDAAIGMALVAPGGRWLKVNRALCEIVGYTEKELLERSFQDITHPEDLDVEVALANRVLTGEILQYSRAKRYLHRDGRVVWVLLSVSLVRNEKGEPLHFIAQIQDIAERDLARKALEASEERLRSVIDNMIEGLIICDGRSVIDSANSAAERMFGYGRGELVGQHLRILLPRYATQNADAYLQDAARKALGRVTRWEGRKRSGDVFPFELSLYNFETSQGRRFAGYIRDVSELDRLERMKKEFVATVSHELRTPLTSIRGSLRLLSGGALGELPDEARDVVAIAERNTLRLITLINDILDLERLEMGRMEIRFERHDAATIVERSVESVRGLAEQQRVSLDVRPSGAPVWGDPDRLVQVLVNLLSNAIKFSPEGGNVTVTCEETSEGAEFRVADKGRGIPASHRELIFQRFQQVESSDARKKGGTGLGLAICKAIVEQHGGTIGVESEPGRGSTFWFRVASRPTPATQDAFVSALHDGLTTAPGSDVLIVENDEALLGVLTRQLLQEGLSVRSARGRAEGLRVAREQPPALLVLDVALPDGDGFDLVTALREDPALKTTPLLVYTVLDLTEAERERLRLGTTRVLIKSRATDEEFKVAVLDMIAERRAEEGLP